MSEKNPPVNPTQQKKTVQLILDFFHRTMMHHAMWFAEDHEPYEGLKPS